MKTSRNSRTPCTGARRPRGRTGPASWSPTADTEGAAEQLALYAGQSVGLAASVEHAGVLVRRIAAEAEAILAGLASECHPLEIPAGFRFREAGPGDAAALLALKRGLDQETSFMLLEPDERTENEQDIAADLAAMAAAGNSVVMLAEVDGQLVGYTEARGGRFRRGGATAHVVIGVLAAAGGRGVGTRLLRELDLWAPAHGIHRLELTVMAHNERAAALYRRVGYTVEGRARECLLVDGRLADELYMAKLFNDPVADPG